MSDSEAYSVFISHAASDHAIAEELCTQLEARGVRCWFAPRDVPPGREFTGAISQALNRSRYLVVLVSAAADQSTAVHREVEQAVHRRLPIIPIRIEPTVPSSGLLEYFLSSTLWIDAVGDASPDQLTNLARQVDSLIARSESPAPASPRSASKIGWRLPQIRRGQKSEMLKDSECKDRVLVWYGTNRRPLYQDDKIIGFTGERDDTVRFGWCRVAVPESHKIGSIGSPWWKRLLLRKDDVRDPQATPPTIRAGV